MKNTLYTLLAAVVLLGSCVPMDIAPKSQGNSASWYTTEVELRMAANEFYILGYWNYLESSERWTDNNTYRNINYNTPILDGTVTGETYDCYGGTDPGSTWNSSWANSEWTKSSVEGMIQALKSMIDGRNNKAQTDMTRLQQLVDRRDESFSTASSLMTSVSDTRGNLIRNL